MRVVLFVRFCPFAPFRFLPCAAISCSPLGVCRPTFRLLFTLCAWSVSAKRLHLVRHQSPTHRITAAVRSGPPDDGEKPRISNSEMSVGPLNVHLPSSRRRLLGGSRGQRDCSIFPERPSAFPFQHSTFNVQPRLVDHREERGI